MLRTTAGTYTSDKVEVQTHKMTDLSGITITTGILPQSMRENLAVAVDRIGAKIVDSVRIDTTHFVTTEGRGMQWEKAVEMNIPVVRPEWVDACEKSGRILGVTKFYLDAMRPGPPVEDRPGTASQQYQQQQHQQYQQQQQQQQHSSPVPQASPPAPSPAPAPAQAPTPPAKDKDLPSTPPATNGEQSSEKREEDEKPENDYAAVNKEEAVEGDDKAESEEDEDEDEDEQGQGQAADEKTTEESEQEEAESNTAGKQENLAVHPKLAAFEDADEPEPSPASRASFQDVQL